MVVANKNKQALTAIHDLLIEARILAYQNIEGKDLAELLDGIEYLPALLLEENDNTELFETYLNELCLSHGYTHISTKYKSN